MKDDQQDRTRIVVVDDDENLRRLVAAYLESEAEILTLVSHTYRQLCSLQVLPGGLRQFFAGLQQDGGDAEERTRMASPAPADDDRPRSGTA